MSSFKYQIHSSTTFKSHTGGEMVHFKWTIFERTSDLLFVKVSWRALKIVNEK